MNSEIGQHQASPSQLKLIIILKISCFCVFIGRAWEHLRWDPPYRALFWDQSLLEKTIERFTGLSWTAYATSTAVDNLIQTFTHSMGWFYILCAVASLVVTRKGTFIDKVSKYILLTGCLSLTFLAFLYSKERFFEIGQFLEYAAQFGSPLILVLLISDFSKERVALFLKIAVALTFICHGLYALNYYPIPGNWVDMVLLTFNVSEQKAIDLLRLAGILDIVFSFLIFIPSHARPACLYLFFWGLVTAVARVYTNLYIDSMRVIIEQFLHEVIYRAPHFLLPLLLFFINKKEKQTWIDRLKSITIVSKKIVVKGANPDSQ